MKVQDYVYDVNDDLYLPGLQREFVWDKDQITKLFDSLIRGYPVGAITTWDSGRSGDNYTAYEFITKYIEDDVYAPKRFETTDTARRIHNLTLNQNRS